MEIKRRQIRSKEEIECLKCKLIKSSENTKEKLVSLVSSSDPLGLFIKMKFEKIGCDPLKKDQPWNIIEQINQTFTYLASLLAVEYLLGKHPKAIPFTLNLGTENGPDICSDGDGGIVAEVFAATNPNNNGKLTNDVNKVKQEGKERKCAFKYVFYMCPDFEGKQPSKEQDVVIWALPFNNQLLKQGNR